MSIGSEVTVDLQDQPRAVSSLRQARDAGDGQESAAVGKGDGSGDIDE